MIDKLAGNNFCYITNDGREKLSRTEAIKQFDFDLANRLIIYGVTEIIKGQRAYIPELEEIIKNDGYKIHFLNNGDGWEIQNIFKGPIVDQGYFNH